MNRKNMKEIKRIEKKIEIQTYLDRLKYALESEGTVLKFAEERRVDSNRDKIYTNKYTISVLFPDEDIVTVLKRELVELKIDEYVETIKDIKRPKYSEYRVFGKQYSGQDVYIKIRLELASSLHACGENYIFVMSFHFAEFKLVKEDFPHRED